MPNRFVILHHVLRDGEHWDLMLEDGEVLLTWQLVQEPTGAESLPIPARRISDHRKVYLDYEGPLSGDRGYVERFDRGPLTIIHRSDGYYVVELAGDRLTGRFALRQAEAGWVMERA